MIQTNILLKSEKHENTVKNKSYVYLICYWCESHLINPRGLDGGWSGAGENRINSLVSCAVGCSVFVLSCFWVISASAFSWLWAEIFWHTKLFLNGTCSTLCACVSIIFYCFRSNVCLI